MIIRSTNDFTDSPTFSCLLPYILHPYGLTGHSKTLIDNIFCNPKEHEVISGDVAATISDHLS